MRLSVCQGVPSGPGGGYGMGGEQGAPILPGARDLSMSTQVQPVLLGSNPFRWQLLESDRRAKCCFAFARLPAVKKFARSCQHNLTETYQNWLRLTKTD